MADTRPARRGTRGEVRAASLRDLGWVEDLYHASTDHNLPHRNGESGLAADHGLPVRLWQLVTRSLSAMLPMLYPGDQLYVYDDRGPCGFIQASAPQTSRRAAWHVVNLCVLPEADAGEVGGALIQHLCNQAVEHGVHRLLVRVAVDEPLRPVFQRNGFKDYATEHVMVGETAAPSPESGDTLRPARGADLAGIFNLYLRTTPAAVALVEGNTFKDWRSTHAEQLTGLGRSAPGLRHLVLDRVELDGWVRLQEGSPTRPHELRFMAAHDGTDLAGTLVDAALASLAAASAGTAWCPVRHYDTEVIAALRRRGFETLGSQALMVRQLALPARVPAKEKEKQKGLAPAFG